jgi:hypothetical protein
LTGSHRRTSDFFRRPLLSATTYRYPSSPRSPKSTTARWPEHSAGCRAPSSCTNRVSFPDPQQTFKHALTHDVGYGSLLQDHRRMLT